jgi:hypothetical protein
MSHVQCAMTHRLSLVAHAWYDDSHIAADCMHALRACATEVRIGTLDHHPP